MSRGSYPLLRPSGQPWTPTSPDLDHPLREIPRWVLNTAARVIRGEVLGVGEEEKLIAWREAQVKDKRQQEHLWPDDHAVIKKPWVEVQ